MVGACGKYGHTLKIRPPLVFTQANADRFVAVMDEALTTTD